MMNKKKASPNGTTSLSTTGKKKIREAIENVKEGRVSKVYDNVDEMAKDLKRDLLIT